jgi:hypothetical protein
LRWFNHRFHFGAWFDEWFDNSRLLTLSRFFFCLVIRCNLEVNFFDCACMVDFLVWGLIFIPSHSWELDVTDEATAPVSDDKLFWFVLAEFIDSGDNCVGHGNFIPAASDNFLHGMQAHKLASALDIAAGPWTNGALRARQWAVPWSIFLANLATLANLETQMLLAVQSLARHNRFRTDSIQNTALCWEVIQQFHGEEDNMHHQ